MIRHTGLNDGVDGRNSGLPEFRFKQTEVGKCRLRVKPGHDGVLGERSPDSSREAGEYAQTRRRP
ncbi:hypothetical protein [Ancylobacter novellus]|uniref:hypothetical protein n=1 Tax=Ancylobacter novellus TaxID=921 RepID=UPI0002F0F9C1|nr:hypothetical protein [Ancylobacter novellus]